MGGWRIVFVLRPPRPKNWDGLEFQRTSENGRFAATVPGRKVVQLYGLPGTGRSETDVGPGFLGGPDRSARVSRAGRTRILLEVGSESTRGVVSAATRCTGGPKIPRTLPAASRDQFSAGMTSSTRCSNDVLRSLSLTPGSWGRMTRRFIPQFFLY